MTKEERQIAAEAYFSRLKRHNHFPVSESIVKAYEAGAEAEAESKWISVEDRLPENNINTQYLVIVRDAVNGKKWYSVQRYYNDKWMGNFDNLCYVSHWQFITPLNQQ